MDPISAAIVAALAAGATKVGKDVIVDGYQALKALIKRKFGTESEIAKAIDGLEARPDSEGRKATLKEEVAAAKADQDPEVLKAAQELLSKIEAQPDGRQITVTASGERSVAAGGGITGSTIVSGDHATVDQRGSILNIESNLSGAIQTVGAAANVEPALQKQLQQLLEQLHSELKQVPPDKAPDAEAVATMAKQAVTEATKEKPNKTTVQISGDGLKKAAENLGAVMPKVLETASLIVTTIGQFVK